MIVVDASVLAGMLLPDEAAGAAADRLTERLRDGVPLAAPWLLWVELRNILVVCERRGRVTEEETAEIFAAVSDLAVALDTAPVEAEVMRLARAYRLSAYDALYLELTQRRGAALASLDARLLRAARAEKALTV